MRTWSTPELRLGVGEEGSHAPGGAADHAAEIDWREIRVLVGEHVGLDVAEGRARLVPDAVVERLDDVFLELRGADARAQPPPVRPGCIRDTSGPAHPFRRRPSPKRRQDACAVECPAWCE